MLKFMEKNVMDMTLIFPPVKGGERYNPYNPITPFPPLGLANIAAVLEERGYNVNIYDCEVTRTSYKDLIISIKKNLPKVIGISALTAIIHRSLRIGQILKLKFPDIPLVFGGPHVTIFPKETLRDNKFIDFVIFGEGEYSTLEMLEEVENSSPNFSKIKGLGYKENGKTIFNEQRPYVKNIDEFPLPARHLLPLNQYKTSKWVVKRPPGTSAVVSRGCPYRCTFCSKAIWGDTVRERSPEKVIEEILDLKVNYGINDIVFADDTFTINRKRVLKICELIKKNKIEIAWSCLTRVDRVDKELLLRMRKSGCHQIGYGAESGSQKILNIMKKDITLKQARFAFRITKKAGIGTRAFIMLGLPGETRETSRKTLNFLKELDPDYANIYIYSPFPGTELFSIAKKMGKIENFNWSQFNKFSPVYTPNGMTREEIIKEYNLIIRKFYLSPHYFKKRIKKIDNFFEFRKNFSLALQLIRGLIQKKGKN